jgi:hypothetical protein
VRVSNQSNGPTNWTQNGSGPQQETASQSGSLQAGQETGELTPSGQAPYWVTFTNGQTVTSCKFSNPDATVTLNKNWTVSVSTGCD